MTLNPEEIARLIDRLDHPDAVHQREVMSRLVALGADAVPVVTANLRLVNPRVRRALAQVLGEMGDSRAIVPLMRYVFDARGDVEESDGRALAMKALLRLGADEQADRLFSFAVDMRNDPDPFVRAYALDLLAHHGDQRALAMIEEGLVDADELVRERAREAAATLRRRSSEGVVRRPDELELAPEEVLRKIRGASGGELSYWIGVLNERSDRFELARRLVVEQGPRVSVGLQVLLGMDDPRSRQVAGQTLRSEPKADHQAMALRLLAKHLTVDATATEVEAIAEGLGSRDDFVRAAAIEAAGRAGDEGLYERLLREVASPDPSLTVAAAEAVCAASDERRSHWFGTVRDRFEAVHSRRLRHPTEDWVRAEAFLLRSLSRLLTQTGPVSARAREAAFLALQGAMDRRPILVTSLELLYRVASLHDPLPEEGFWSVQETASLAALLGASDMQVRRRALDLLRRGAARGVDLLALRLRDLAADQSLDPVEDIIPLLRRTGTDEAQAVLAEYETSQDERVRLAAEAACRAIRNEAPYIEAHFEPSEGEEL